MRHTLIAILGVLLFCNPPLSHADSDVDYSPAMEEYIGTWVCSSAQIDRQFIPDKIEIKKKGKKIKWTFYRLGGKAPKDFYSGPYVYGDTFSGHFTFSTNPQYRDYRPSQQQKIKYDFKTHMTYSDRAYTNILYITVSLWYYNELGNIDIRDVNICYEKEH